MKGKKNEKKSNNNNKHVWFYLLYKKNIFYSKNLFEKE